MGRILKYDTFASVALSKSLGNVIPSLIDIKVFKDIEQEKSIAIWKVKAGRYPSFGRTIYSHINLEDIESKIRSSRKFILDISIGTVEPEVFKLSLLFKAKCLFEAEILEENYDFNFITIKNIVADFLKESNHKTNLLESLMNYDFSKASI